MFVSTLLTILFHIAFISKINAQSTWKPSFYPEYCSEDGTLNDISSENRAIPPLSTTELNMIEELKQVQVMIRHGARTPYAKLSCWKDYDIDWNNCKPTELVLPSPSRTSNERMAPWLFRKLYDAFPDLLGGNCYTGQLILEGFNQEAELGNLFRDTYTPYQDGVSYDPKLHVMEDTNWATVEENNLTYFRSTDLQRTLMSGQVFVYNLFNVSENDEDIVSWHTGDNSIDNLSPSNGACPYLATIEDNAYDNDTFIVNNATITGDLNGFLTAQLGTPGTDWEWSQITDCFMTTICTEREIPNPLVDQGQPGWTDELFNQTINADQYAYFWKMKFNNSEWSRLGMSDIVYNVHKNAENMQNSVLYNNFSFVLYSAHDTSVIPFVDALLPPGQTIDFWAPYASYVSVEMYEATAATTASTGETHYFRVIYNGQVLQPNGCSNTGLCKGSEFMTTTIGWGESLGGDTCQQTTTSADTNDDPSTTDCHNNKNDVEMDSGLFAGVIILSILFGAGMAGVVFKYQYWDDMVGRGGLSNRIPKSDEV